MQKENTQFKKPPIFSPNAIFYFSLIGKLTTILIRCPTNCSDRLEIRIRPSVRNNMRDYDTYVELVKSSDPRACLEGVSYFRELLQDPDPPISDIIHSGTVPQLVRLMDSEDDKIKFETLWIITNLMSDKSHDAQYVVSLGVVPKLVALLQASSSKIVAQVFVYCVSLDFSLLGPLGLVQHLRRWCSYARHGFIQRSC